MSDRPDPLAALEEYMVQLRGRGLVLSSSDLALLDSWVKSGVPQGVLLAGIDAAAAAMRRPPHSVGACRPYILKSIAAWSGELAQPLKPEPGQSAPAEVVDEAPQESTEERLRGWLRARCAMVKQPPVARAFQTLMGEVEQIIASEGSVSTRVLAVLDEALVDYILEDASVGEWPAELRVSLQKGPADRALSEVSKFFGESDWSALPPEWRIA